jgi:hypothetical protein
LHTEVVQGLKLVLKLQSRDFLTTNNKKPTRGQQERGCTKILFVVCFSDLVILCESPSMTHHQQSMYLEVVSASMKSQCYEIPDQASVLLTTSAPGFNFAKQSKSIPHLDATTSKQWWMFKEVFVLSTAMKEQRLQIKLYGSSITTASAAAPPTADTGYGSKSSRQQKDQVLLKLPKGNTSRLELCIGKLDLPLSSLVGSTAMTFDLSPVSLIAHEDKDKDKNISILKRSVQSTITLRLLSDPPPLPPSSAVLDTVAVREKEERDDAPDDDDRLLGTVRVVVWQGKSLNTEYPVFLDTRMNQQTVRRWVRRSSCLLCRMRERCLICLL